MEGVHVVPLVAALFRCRRFPVEKALDRHSVSRYSILSQDPQIDVRMVRSGPLELIRGMEGAGVEPIGSPIRVYGLKYQYHISRVGRKGGRAAYICSRPSLDSTEILALFQLCTSESSRAFED